METLYALVDIWYMYAIASCALIWYATSTDKARRKRSADEWEAACISRAPDDKTIPVMPGYKKWDIKAYYIAGVIMMFVAFFCLVFLVFDFGYGLGLRLFSY